MGTIYSVSQGSLEGFEKMNVSWLRWQQPLCCWLGEGGRDGRRTRQAFLPSAAPWDLLVKFSIELSMGLSLSLNPLLGAPKWKYSNTLTKVRFVAAFIVIASNWKQPTCSSTERVSTRWDLHPRDTTATGRWSQGTPVAWRNVTDVLLEQKQLNTEAHAMWFHLQEIQEQAKLT